MNTAREAIINELDKNLFVIAGAGSGKTTMLVNRMVAMIESGIDISNICAITFTVNAASRFLVDFQKALKKRSTTPDDHKQENSSDLGPSSQQKREYCKKALENIDLCFAGTIDSFCQRILSEIPYDAGIPSSTALLSDDEASLAYKIAFKEISGDPLDLEKEYYDFISVHSNPAEAFASTISKIKELTVLDLIHDAPSKSIDEVYNDLKKNEIKDLKEDIESLLRAESDSLENNDKGNYRDNFNVFKKRIASVIDNLKFNNANRQLKEIKDLLSGLAFNNDPELDFLGFSLTKGVKGNVNRYVFKNDEFLSSIKEKINNIIYDYSLPFLIKSVDRINKKLKKEGRLSFNDYLLTLRDALIEDMKNGSNIINHISQRYKYFLLDESQDTSPFQTEIFLYLTSMVPATSKHECKPRPGSLFIVGDPKQSIYRFKNADIISYNDTKSMFNDENNKVVELVNNFRSTNELCNYFNHLFKDMPYYTNIPDKDESKYTGLYLANNYINVIKTMVNNPNYLLPFNDKKDKPEELLIIDGKRVRYLQYKDFMLITHSTSPHKKIMDELDSNNIPYFVEGKFNVNDNLILKAIHAIYYYLVDKNNGYYNLLCSPLINLDVKDAVAVKATEIPNNIEDIINRINNIYDKNPIIVFDRIMNDLNIFDRIGYKNMEFAYFLGEKIRGEISNNNIVTLDECEKYIRSFMQSKVERYINMELESKGVYLANLHKVKGLERPVVILISANAKASPASSSCDYINNKSYLFNIEDSSGFANILQTHKYDDIKEIENKELDLEKERLRYVAVTRARNYLIIEDKGKASYWTSLINDDFKGFEEDIKEPEVISNNNDLCQNIEIKYNSEAPYIDETPSKLKKAYKKIDGDVDVDDYKVKTSLATITGTVIHRLMELIVKSNDKYNLDSCIKIIVGEYIIDKKIESLLKEVYETIHTTGYKQANNMPQDILSLVLSAEEKYCEVPFAYKDGNIINQGIIDLIYKKDGNWFIVDYKTNYADKDLDEVYEAQLNAYKKALKEIKGIDAEAYIYHINK